MFGDGCPLTVDGQNTSRPGMQRQSRNAFGVLAVNGQPSTDNLLI